MSAFTFKIIQREEERQRKNIELIASENFVSEDVMKAVGSCFTNKYAEGYPSLREMGRNGRYYGGCQYADELEEFCCNIWKSAFRTNYHVNVQPHSGTNANMAAYMAVLDPGDTILAMDMNSGGHLSHGSPVNFSGKIYNFEYYGLDEKGYLNYDELEAKAKELRPRMIVAGASSYSRIIDYERIADIAASVYAFFMVDMAHVAGLIVAGEHPSPFGLADVITTTTHKTLRGPRGGMIFCKPGWAQKIDGAVFPGTQGGPLMHVIAGKAVAGEEACKADFKQYIHEVVHNSKSMAKEFKRLGYDVVTGGTDNHMFLLDLTKLNMSGKLAQDTLDEHGITVNKNMIPNDPRTPVWTSGIRIGTAAMTTLGYRAIDFMNVADDIDDILTQKVVQRR